MPSSLITTGGGIARLLDGSIFFGPVIRAGLAQKGITGADYEAFLVAAQTVLDSADPVNFAVAAANSHPVHMIEIVGDGTANNLPDQVIPNLVPPLSGTEPLAALMGLPAVSTTVANTPAKANGIVRITQGEHSSLLRPSKEGGGAFDYLNVMTEIHKEIAAYQATFGTVINITDTAIVK